LNHALLAFGLFLLLRFGGIPVIFSPWPLFSEVMLWAGCLILLTNRPRLDEQGIRWTLLGLVGYCTLCGLYQFADGERAWYGHMGDRAFLPFLQPSPLSCFVAMCLPLLWTQEVRWARWAGVGLGALCLGLSGGKCGFLAALVAMLFVVRQRAWLLAIACGVGALAFLPRAFGTGFVTSRLEFWNAALCAIREHPVTGVGAGNFGPWFQTYVFAHNFSLFAHNDFLNLAAEWGVFAGLLYVAVVVAVLWRGLSVAKAARPAVAPYLASFVAFVVCSLVDYPLYVPALGFIAALIGGRILAERQTASRTNPVFFALERVA
jgi:O-antigen ligase